MKIISMKIKIHKRMCVTQKNDQMNVVQEVKHEMYEFLVNWIG